MEGQIKNKFDVLTLKKIGLEALKLAGVTAGLFILNSVLDLDLGAYTGIAIPIVRYFIGILEQFKKGL